MVVADVVGIIINVVRTVVHHLHQHDQKQKAQTPAYDELPTSVVVPWNDGWDFPFVVVIVPRNYVEHDGIWTMMVGRGVPGRTPG